MILSGTCSGGDEKKDQGDYEKKKDEEKKQ
jgi:hypothetical protein